MDANGSQSSLDLDTPFFSASFINGSQSSNTSIASQNATLPNEDGHGGVPEGTQGEPGDDASDQGGGTQEVQDHDGHYVSQEEEEEAANQAEIEEIFHQNSFEAEEDVHEGVPEALQEDPLQNDYLDADEVNEIDPEIRAMVLEYRAVGNQHFNLLADPQAPQPQAPPNGPPNARNNNQNRRGAGRPREEMGGASESILREQYHPSYLITVSFERNELNEFANETQMKETFRGFCEVENVVMDEFCVALERHKTSLQFVSHIHAYVHYKSDVSSTVLLQNIQVHFGQERQIHLRSIRSRPKTLAYITKEDFFPFFNVSPSSFHPNYQKFHRLFNKDELQVKEFVANLHEFTAAQKYATKLRQQMKVKEWTEYKRIELSFNISWCISSICYINLLFEKFNAYHEDVKQGSVGVKRFPKPLVIIGPEESGKTTLIEYVLEKSGAVEYAYRVPNVKSPMVHFNPAFHKVIVIEDLENKRFEGNTILPILKYETDSIVTFDNGLVCNNYSVPVILTSSKAIPEHLKFHMVNVQVTMELRHCRNMIIVPRAKETNIEFRGVNTSFCSQFAISETVVDTNVPTRTRSIREARSVRGT